jgi:hypothetical protein
MPEPDNIGDVGKAVSGNWEGNRRCDQAGPIISTPEL